MAPDKPVNMGLQLFPSPPKKQANPSRKPSIRRHAIIPQSPPVSAVEQQASPHTFPDNGTQSMPPGDHEPHQPGRKIPSPITVPPPAAHIAVAPRSHTPLPETLTLVRSKSNGSHRSPARNGLSGSPPREEPVMRSIFPRYNPELPLEHQAYFPTQQSPTHIPKTIINRRPYSPSLHDRSPAGLQSPMSVGASPGRFPRGVQDESIMEPSNNDDLKELWKVTNGWKVSASEGRRFCLKMTSALEEPVHTLSSATQAFYTLRLDPTSTSAQMSLTRQDPTKPKGTNSPKLGTSSKSNTGIEALNTTLEESARRLPPNDGLVALLYPRAASDMAIEVSNKSSRADIHHVVAAAERECGRLVWDEDSKKYYLAHPALQTPFVISIASSPAWSRSEYILEHPEMPHNLVRLARDGAGSGFLEVDTAVASRIDCFYIVDVAICAVMLVAIAEEKTQNLERFDAPPSTISLITNSPKDKKEKKRKEVKVEEFELDLESQSSLKEQKKKQKEEKVPGCLGLFWMLIKCFCWVITMFFKALAKTAIFLCKCITKRDPK